MEINSNYLCIEILEVLDEAKEFSMYVPFSTNIFNLFWLRESRLGLCSLVTKKHSLLERLKDLIK